MDEMQAVVVAAQTREENIVIASTPLMLCNGPLRPVSWLPGLSIVVVVVRWTRHATVHSLAILFLILSLKTFWRRGVRGFMCAMSSDTCHDNEFK
jgi:hypothetical protein